MKDRLKVFLLSVPVSVLVWPTLLLAQDLGKTQDLATGFQKVMNTVIVIAVLSAFLFFVWGIAQFIRHADEPAGREAGRQQMIWGVVALAVLVSIWGIVLWLQGEILGPGKGGGGVGSILQMFGLGGSGGGSNSSGGSGGDCGGYECI